jgi:hypothetical protein
MLDEIDKLASEVAVAWASAGRPREAFPAIATELLSRPLQLDFTALTAAMFAPSRPLPRQRRLDSGFGQPAITLHNDGDFVVEALCWLVGLPGIHQHAFNGAFRLVTGRSVHTRYAFEERSRVDERLLLGDLRLIEYELLEAGMTRTIEEGPVFIHGAFHLDAPSMTIVVRTHDSEAPEYTYLPPSVALDPASRDVDLHKRLQLLDTLSEVGGDLYLDSADVAIKRGDLYDGIQTVLRASRHRIDYSTFQGLIDRLVERHGVVARFCRAALLEAWRRGRVAALRATRTDPDDRFFLACLLNLPSRTSLVDAMTAYHGTEDEARHSIGEAATWLLGVERGGEAVVSAAVDAMLEDVPAAAFADFASSRLPTTRFQDPAELTALYEDVREQPLLAPLRAY